MFLSVIGISQAKKDSLSAEYETLDPVDMLAQLEMLQDKLWEAIDFNFPYYRLISEQFPDSPEKEGERYD